jgi:hypothetical protein
MATILALAAASLAGSSRSLQIAVDDPNAVGTSVELAATSLAVGMWSL